MEAAPGPAVRRRPHLDAIAADQRVLGEVLRQLAGLGVPEEDGVAQLEVEAGREVERGLHLARAFEPEALGQVR
jgi:hypothetical protein